MYSYTIEIGPSSAKAVTSTGFCARNACCPPIAATTASIEFSRNVHEFSDSMARLHSVIS